MTRAKIVDKKLLLTDDSFIIEVNNEEPIVISIANLTNFMYGTINNSEGEVNTKITLVDADTNEIVKETLTLQGGFYYFNNLNRDKRYRIEHRSRRTFVPDTIIADDVTFPIADDSIEIENVQIKTENEILVVTLRPYDANQENVSSADIELVLTLLDGTEVERAVTDSSGIAVFQESVVLGQRYEVSVKRLGMFFTFNSNNNPTVEDKTNIKSKDRKTCYYASGVFDIIGSVMPAIPVQFALMDEFGNSYNDVVVSPNGTFSIPQMKVGLYTLTPKGIVGRYQSLTTNYEFEVDGSGDLNLGNVFTFEYIRPTVNISGRVIEFEDGSPGVGYAVIVNNHDSGESQTIITGTDGSWSADVTEEDTFSLVVIKSNKTITSDSRVIENVRATRDINDFNFTSKQVESVVFTGSLIYDNVNLNNYSDYIVGNPQEISIDFFDNVNAFVKIFSSNGNLLESIKLESSNWVSTSDFGDVTEFNLVYEIDSGFNITQAEMAMTAERGDLKVFNSTFQSYGAYQMEITVDGDPNREYFIVVDDLTGLSGTPSGWIEAGNTVDRKFTIDAFPADFEITLFEDQFQTSFPLKKQTVTVSEGDINFTHTIAGFTDSRTDVGTQGFVELNVWAEVMPSFEYNYELILYQDGTEISKGTITYEKPFHTFTPLFPSSYELEYKSLTTGDSVIEEVVVTGNMDYAFNLIDIFGDPAGPTPVTLPVFPIRSEIEIEFSNLSYKIPNEHFVDLSSNKYVINSSLGFKYQILKGGEVVSNGTHLFGLDYSSLNDNLNVNPQSVVSLEQNTSYTMIYNLISENGATFPNQISNFTTTDTETQIGFQEYGSVYDLHIGSELLLNAGVTKLQIFSERDLDHPIVDFNLKKDINAPYAARDGFVSGMRGLQKTFTDDLTVFDLAVRLGSLTSGINYFIKILNPDGGQYKLSFGNQDLVKGFNILQPFILDQAKDGISVDLNN